MECRLPLYEYECRQCATVTDVRHGFDEKVAQACPACGGELIRRFSPTGIVFKGSGFYKTDSRAGAPGASGASETPAAAKSDGAASAAGADGGAKTGGAAGGTAASSAPSGASAASPQSPSSVPKPAGGTTGSTSAGSAA